MSRSSESFTLKPPGAMACICDYMSMWVCAVCGGLGPMGYEVRGVYGVCGSVWCNSGACMAYPSLVVVHFRKCDSLKLLCACICVNSQATGCLCFWLCFRQFRHPHCCNMPSAEVTVLLCLAPQNCRATKDELTQRGSSHNQTFLNGRTRVAAVPSSRILGSKWEGGASSESITPGQYYKKGSHYWQDKHRC